MQTQLAVLSALTIELDLLLAEAGEVESEDTPHGSAWRCSLAGRDVVLAQAGLGKVSVATMVGILHERHQPAVFIFTGVAGGLDPTLEIGDIVIGDRVIQHDAGVIEPDGLWRYQAGHIPFFNPTAAFGFGPSPGLLGKVKGAVNGVSLEPVLGRRPQVVFGTILTGDQYLRDEATRDLLHRELGGMAVEMEGGAMAQAAELTRADHLVIRSLSDLAGTDSISDFERFAGEASANSARVVLEVLRRL